MNRPPSPQDDPFRPPAIPTRVHCIHCGQEYESDLIHWAEVMGGKSGFWRCPVPGCDGAGFGFDIFPTDPEYRDEHGNLMYCEDDKDVDWEDPSTN